MQFLLRTMALSGPKRAIGAVQGHPILAVTLLFCLINIVLGCVKANPPLTGGGAIGLCYVLVRWGCRPYPFWTQIRRGVPAQAPPRPASPTACRKPIDPTDTHALAQQMLAQGRYALLLRPQIAENLGEDLFRRTLEAMHGGMALVPDGDVVLGRIDAALDDGRLDDEEIAAGRGRVVQVKRFFLDRYPLTNRQFYEFVAAGGYEQMALWEEAIWPAVLDFVDRTRTPGPRYWHNGCYRAGEEDHPLVGVSWYEAFACARWLGKRLPSDAEWVKAGSWPVALSATARVQRRYPWGDTMDRKRANLWGSEVRHTVAVGEFSEGVSVGGVYQLTGNVWEWTSGNFRGEDHPLGQLDLPTPMRSIRGGAFDTYFDGQAACQFQSGENPLGRRHNIGFRCAIGVCDLVLARPGHTQAGPPGDALVAAGQEVHS